MLGARNFEESPMASSYLSLTREIEALKKKAEAARKHEAAELVALIKSGIELYGLTAQDLGLTTAAAKPGKKAKKAATAPQARSAAVAAPAAKYADGAGHSWSGRGPRPGWVKATLEAGQSLDDLLTTAKRKSSPTSKSAGKTWPPEKKAVKSAKKAAATTSAPASTARYKDDAGNSWSGRGPKPGWLRAAIESGKSMDDFLA
jgi:DNA-binding protein H-NS